MDNTTIVAFYAAVVATLSLLFQGITVWRSRSSLKIEVEDQTIMRGGHEEYVTTVDLMNTGGRTLYIQSIGFMPTNGEIVSILSGPVRLLAGERYGIALSVRLDLSHVDYFYAIDGIGRWHKIPATRR